MTVPTIRTRIASPHEAAASALLRQSHAYLASLYPAEHNHHLSVDALAVPEITFLLAEDGTTATGCAALADRMDYGEIKSMFVDPAARGSGTGAALMAALGAAARDLGLPVLRLETGDTLDAAQRLYLRHGFVPCGPFGDYAEGPHSVFLERRL